MPRAVLLIAAAALLGVVCWFFPLVRVIPISDRSTTTSDSDPRVVAEHLWTEKLPTTFANANDASAALALLVEDAAAARKQYGTTQGVSRGFQLYLHGTGKVLSKDKKGVAVGLGENSAPQFILQTGMIFGNTVRDTTGLMKSSEAPSSEMFNAVAQELNLLVERRVTSKLASTAAIGDSIEFVGCVDIKDPEHVSLPLLVVPVSITIESPN